MDLLCILFLTTILLPIFWRLITKYAHVSGFESGCDMQRTVLISGCDSGFGHLLALRLIKKGILTFAGCLSQQGVDELRLAARNDKNLVTFRLDVASQNSVDGAVDLVKRTLNEKQVLWAIVNNAGIPGCGPEDWMVIQDYQRCLDINCLGAIRLTHAFLPMLKKSRGRIVTITSMYARWAQAWGGPYAVSKYAMRAYLDALRCEVSIYGITVHAVEPGFYRTNLTSLERLRLDMKQHWDRLPEKCKDEYGDEYFEKCLVSASAQFDWYCKMNLWGIDGVVDDYYHALTAKWPRANYYPGFVMKVIPLFLWLPTGVLDFIQKSVIKMRGYPLPKVCEK